MMTMIIISRRVFAVLTDRVGILAISIVFIGIRSGGAVAGEDPQHSAVGVTHSVAGVMALVGIED